MSCRSAKSAFSRVEFGTDSGNPSPSFDLDLKPGWKLLAKLRTETDLRNRLSLHAQIQKALTTIDKARFAWQADGHFEAHFGIVGFTSPSPVGDGKHVWGSPSARNMV